MRGIILLLVARTAWATPVKTPPCALADPNAYIAVAVATPLVRALEAKRWKVQGSIVYQCIEQFVDVGVMLSPPGKPWPTNTRLTLRLGFDATPVADAEWERSAKALLADLDLLWNMPAVTRFGELVGIKHAGITFLAGRSREPSAARLPFDVAGVTLMSKEFTDTSAIMDASKLGIWVAPRNQRISSLTTMDPKLLSKLDAFVPDFSKHCTLDPDDKRVDYDGENNIVKLAYNALCPTCGRVTECKL